MTSVLRLRKAVRADQPALEDLQRRASLVYEANREALLAHPDAIAVPLEQVDAGDVFLAERGGRIVGFAAVVARDDGDAELDAIFVEPECWKQGIGRVLLDEAERIASRRGARAMHVTANPDALAFYGARGYVVDGETQTRFAPAPTMIKALPR
jgi:GNAT superfamily N-acetyltransferase